jgi:alkaline phosphatase
MVCENRRGIHVFLSVLILLIAFNAAVEAGPRAGAKGVRNVILLVADGASVSHLTLARWYNGGMPLALDEWICGLVRTYGANMALTDSAPAATAFASGFKSSTGSIGILPAAAS